jgi:hypothetical protein
MTEIVTQATEQAIKLRCERARRRLEQSNCTETWMASVIVLATYALNRELRVPAIERHVYTTARAALADAAQNLEALLRAPFYGAIVRSAADLIQTAREIESACKAISQDKS